MASEKLIPTIAKMEKEINRIEDTIFRLEKQAHKGKHGKGSGKKDNGKDHDPYAHKYRRLREKTQKALDMLDALIAKQKPQGRH